MTRLSAVAVLVLTALAGPRVGAQPAGGGPQVAILLPLSGDYEHIGAQLLDTLVLALEEHAGASWVVVDTGGDAAVAARRARELAANPSILAVVGPVGRLESRAAADAAAPLGLPLLTLSAEEGIEDAGRSVLRLRVAPQEQARFMARVATDELGFERLACLYPDDPYGRASARAFVEAALQRGARVTALETYGADETNLNDALELLVAQRARRLRGQAWRGQPSVRARRRSSLAQVEFEAIFAPERYDRLGLVAAFLSFWDVPVGRSVQMLGPSSWLGPAVGPGVESVNGALFSVVFHDGQYAPGAARFAERFRERFGRAPTEADAQAYDAMSLLLGVLLDREPVGGWTRGGVVDTLLSSPPHDGVAGPVELSSRGAVVRPLALFSVGRGGWVGPYVILR